MFSPKQLADIDLILDHYGHDHQMVKTVEELGECIVAITRLIALNHTNNASLKEHAIEEVADALIMLTQARIILGKDDVDSVIQYKIGRTADRILSERIK